MHAPRPRRSPALALLVLLVLLALPANAHAFLIGAESNGELSNSSLNSEQQLAVLDRMKAQGVQVVRVNMAWSDIASSCGGVSISDLQNHEHPCYNWTRLDTLARGAGDRRMLLLVSVSRTPQWVHGSDDTSFVGSTTAQWVQMVRHFGAFMTAAGTRYRTGSPHGAIRLWTIWNEPNSPTFWKPNTALTPRNYAQLYARGAVALKAVHPNALVAPGPTGPRANKPVYFIASVQRYLPMFLPGTGLAERRYINAWAHNPYPGITSPRTDGTRSPAIGMGNLRDLFVVLDRSPLTRRLPVWATEFGWQTNPPDAAFGVKLLLQGIYMAEAFDILDSYRRVSLAIWYGHTDPTEPSDWQSGTYFSNGRAKPSLYWYRRPITIAASNVRRGSAVRVWARSNVNPGATRIAYSFNGRSWRLLPLQGRRRDGVTLVAVRVTRRIWLATYDGTRGPARIVNAR